MNKNKKFEWTEEHEEAFQELKRYLSSAPLPVKPRDREPLLIYLLVSSNAVSDVLAKDLNRDQHLIYYVSKSLLDPIKNVMRKPEMLGRMRKWSVKLSTFDIKYDPRSTIKSQALA